jgi:transposase
MDESKFNINNEIIRKEWREKGSPPTQRKVLKFPPSVMISIAIGKGYKSLVFHDERKSRSGNRRWASRAEMVEDLGIEVSHIRLTRYTMRELDELSDSALDEFLDVEGQFLEANQSVGVGAFEHCNRVLMPIQVEAQRRRKTLLVLQDNAQIHVSNYSTVFKNRRMPDVEFIEGHPPDSADLNPCEFVFSWLKRRVAEHGPRTAEELKRRIEVEFRMLPRKTIDSWIDMYRKRLQACVDREGDWVGTRECRHRRHGRIMDIEWHMKHGGLSRKK